MPPGWLNVERRLILLILLVIFKKKKYPEVLPTCTKIRFQYVRNITNIYCLQVNFKRRHIAKNKIWRSRE